MSSLISFRIISKKENYLDVEVQIVHPDEHHINDSANFALQIILELYETIRQERIYNSGWSHYPFDAATAKTLVNPEYQAELDELLEKMRWRKIPITEQEHDEIQKSGKFEYQGQKLSSIGMENNIYYASLETEYDAFCQEADRHIEKVEVLRVQDFPHWFDRLETWLKYDQISWGFEDDVYEKHQDELNPAYHLRITVAPESLFLLHYVQEDCFWESAAYDFLYYTKSFEDTKQAIYHTLAYSSEIVPPSDEVLQAWWNDLSENWKKAIHVNYYLQKTNIFPSIKHNFDGMITRRQFEHIYSKKLLESLLASQLNLEDLRNISQMNMLYISGFELTDLAPLHIFKGLKLLDSESNPLQNIDALEHLTQLEKLTLIIYESKKPNHQVLKNLTKLRYLSFDPETTEELSVIQKMPQLRTFYTILPFELDATVLENLSHLKKVVGYSPSISKNSKEILEKLRTQGVDVTWDTE